MPTYQKRCASIFSPRRALRSADILQPGASSAFRSFYKRLGRAALACFGSALCLAPARAGDAFTSPAVNPSLFQRDAVRRIEGAVGSWRYVCDEIILLKRRICSLSTILYEQNGEAIGAFVVSTDERGRPATLLRLRPPLALRQGIELHASYEVKSAAKRRLLTYTDKLTIDLCDDKICTAFFYMRDEIVYALSSTQNVQITDFSAENGRPSWQPGLDSIYLRKIAYVKGDGFSQALEKSGQ